MAAIIHCRLKEEHIAKLRPLQEAHDQLLAELSARQDNDGQLQQLKTQLDKLSSRCGSFLGSASSAV